MKVLFIAWAFAIGMIVPLQAIINAKLSKEIGGPSYASLISFAGGFIIFALMAAFNYKNFPSLEKLQNLPPYMYASGIVGALFVISAIMILPKLGSTGWTALIVTGQLIASLIMDHYGMFGLAQKTVSMARVTGAVLLILGSSLIVYF